MSHIPCAFILLVSIAAPFLAWGGAAAPKRPVKVSFESDNAPDADVPIDPKPRLNYSYSKRASLSLHLSEIGAALQGYHFPTINIDGRAIVPGVIDGAYFSKTGERLPKKRHGYESVWVANGICVTQRVELVPSKARDGSRFLDATIVHYALENVDTTRHVVGLRTRIDPLLGASGPCRFTASTCTGKLLEALELKGADAPSYVRVLQKPDLENPNRVAFVSFGFGFDKPDRVVFTTSDGRLDSWDLAPRSDGSGATIAFFWDPVELPARGRRDIAYAYGTGLVESYEPDLGFTIRFGGSFEPGKQFTITATVSDPGEVRTLELLLPKGMELMEGKAIQPVAAPAGAEPFSIVIWKARVTELGRFPVRVRSNSGAAWEKTVRVQAE